MFSNEIWTHSVFSCLKHIENKKRQSLQNIIDFEKIVWKSLMDKVLTSAK